MTVTATSPGNPLLGSLVSRPCIISVTAHNRHETAAVHIPPSPMTSDQGPELGPQPQPLPHSCQVHGLMPWAPAVVPRVPEQPVADEGTGTC